MHSLVLVSSLLFTPAAAAGGVSAVEDPAGGDAKVAPAAAPPARPVHAVLFGVDFPLGGFRPSLAYQWSPWPQTRVVVAPQLGLGLTARHQVDHDAFVGIDTLASQGLDAHGSAGGRVEMQQGWDGGFAVVPFGYAAVEAGVYGNLGSFSQVAATQRQAPISGSSSRAVGNASARVIGGLGIDVPLPSAMFLRFRVDTAEASVIAARSHLSFINPLSLDILHDLRHADGALSARLLVRPGVAFGARF